MLPLLRAYRHVLWTLCTAPLTYCCAFCNATLESHFSITSHGAPFIQFSLLLNIIIQTEGFTTQLCFFQLNNVVSTAGIPACACASNTVLCSSHLSLRFLQGNSWVCFKESCQVLCWACDCVWCLTTEWLSHQSWGRLCTGHPQLIQQSADKRTCC